MKLNVTQKILIGYIVGFILLLAFATLTYLNGKKIEATTVALSQEKIPGLIAVSSLKSQVQKQANQLYELYATNDQAAFKQRHQATVAVMQQDTAKLRALDEFKAFESTLDNMNIKQAELTNNFIKIMQQPEVDWDAAREALSAFSNSAKAMDSKLDALVDLVAKLTIARADDSQKLTDQLINVGLALAALTFLGVLGMAYYSHRKVAVPLRNVSEVLNGIAARKDLTYRIKQESQDEIGEIAISTNKLLEAFQKLALGLDQSAQELNRTTNKLASFTENAQASVVERNVNLRGATQDFLREIEVSAKLKGAKEVDKDLHMAQMKFIQSHLTEIDAGTKANDHNVQVVKNATDHLKKLVDLMHGKIRELNF